VQPIRADLAALLKTWLKGKPRKEPLFAALPSDTARMLRTDLARARAAWINEAGSNLKERNARERSDFLCYRNGAGEIADFHATRHTFVSALAASGAPVKTVQELARHSTPTLTFGRYAHARSADVSGALNALPANGSAPQNGTSVQTSGEQQGEQLERQTVRGGAISGDESALLASIVSAAASTEVATECEVMREKTASDDQRRWWELNPRWRICNPLP
jgi:hypothetical protein